MHCKCTQSTPFFINFIWKTHFAFIFLIELLGTARHTTEPHYYDIVRFGLSPYGFCLWTPTQNVSY